MRIDHGADVPTLFLDCGPCGKEPGCGMQENPFRTTAELSAHIRIHRILNFRLMIKLDGTWRCVGGEA
jgi:hypothetical protein